MTASAFADALRDRYRLERELGRGGMATVYLAHDLKHDREVALKVLHPELAAALGPERFQREIRTTARLQHPHILPVLDSGEAAGRVWYTMPFIAGESLRVRLRREGQLPVEVAVELTHQAALALAYAHRQGVVHRDLKPENILLSEGQALIADFGVAKALTETGQGGLTETGMAVGTPAYMSPEQATGGSIDGRTDIYALGCVLYEMLTGEPPFSGPTHQAIMAKRMLEPVPHVRTLRETVPEALDQVVARSLAKVPADRFATAEELGRAVQESLVPAASSATATPLPAPTPTASGPLPSSRRRMPLVSMALVVGFLIGLGVLFAWRRSRGTRDAGAGSRVVAVLPFESLGDSADAYFADGVTDEVRTKLGQIAGLEVIARGSSAEYRGTAKSLSQIARELGADYLLTARVRWNKAPGQPSRVRLTAELVDASSGRAPRTRWGQNFDAAISDVFQVQADIASQVAGALDVALGDSLTHSLAERPTDNIDAYDAYLRGLEKVKGDYSPAALHAAERELQRAVHLDSSFAAAWAALGKTHLDLFRLGGVQMRDLERARAEIERAVALAPDLPTVRLAQGALLEYRGDLEGALRVYEAGLQVAPSNVAFLGQAAGVKADLGRYDAAMADLERASRLDPRSPGLARRRYRIHFDLRRYDEAQAAMDQVRSLMPVGVSLIHEQAWLRAAMGDLPGARRALASAYEIADSTAVVAYVALREDLLWLLEDREQRRVLTLTPADLDGGRADWALALAETYYRRGDRAKARAYGDSAYAAYVSLIPHSLSEGDRAQGMALQALSLATGGNSRAAIARGEAALSAAPAATSQRIYVQSLLIRVLIMGGQHERALDLLEPLVRERRGPISPGLLRIDRDFDPLRGNPRFEQLASGS